MEDAYDAAGLVGGGDVDGLGVGLHLASFRFAFGSAKLVKTVSFLFVLQDSQYLNW